MSPPSPNIHPDRDTTRGESSASRAPSPYHELRQWDPDEDLIQLEIPSLDLVGASYRKKPYGSHGSNDGTAMSGTGKSSGGIPPLQKQYSLIDLDDQSSDRAEEELDDVLNLRLQAATGPGTNNETSFSSNPIQRQDFVSSRPEFRRCEQCEMYGPKPSYCNVCNVVFCDRCWNLQITHKKSLLAPGAVRHEKTDHDVAKKIEAVLELKASDEQQADLHRDDRDTTWFGIIREDSEQPVFRDYGRYAAIMADTSRLDRFVNFTGTANGRDTRYPSLVSFVGQTGAGKSSIIKLVIDLSARREEKYATPVVGSVGKDVPTSGDVHLYPDPGTAGSDTPILYADCEGLQGGEREPLGAWPKPGDSNLNESFEQNLRDHGSEREITWATNNLKSSREYAVKHLYPRLLYTFSDVVVYVLKTPRIIESVFEELVNWAAAALETSSNQPVLPHAIIVLNASENDIDPSLWDVESATSVLLDSLLRTVFNSPVFGKHAQFWPERDRNIDTVQQLLLSYYSSITVVRIPTSGRPNLINDQIQKLYDHIQRACTSARHRKGKLRMLLDADELQPYLQFAFDHFARDLDTPFDFVQASFTNSPIPLNFGGNILKLAINLMEVWENEADGRTLFVELSYMVASCIMLDSARHKLRGTAEKIFPQYLVHVDAALENFCDRHWPCEYVKSGEGVRCVNVRSGHGSKGHQRRNGKVLTVGGYISRFSFESFRKEFQDLIYTRLDDLLKLLRSRIEEGAQPEGLGAAEIHKDKVMVHFFDHAARGRVNSFISHSTCFSCLFEPPERALPCGHVLCTLCLRAYGKPRSKTEVDIKGCPMEKPISRRHQFCNVSLKPAAAGIRILTLDGGGTRGIAELETLTQIQRAMGGNMALQYFFDLIVGTSYEDSPNSTGGIIALGLGAKHWSVEQCTRQFEDLCRKAFTRRAGGNIPYLGWFIDNYNHSKYETQPLEEALISAFSESECLFGGARPPESFGSDVKVAVTTTSAAGNTVVLTNYNRICDEKLSYHFQRPERLESELKLWEAARATSAAPRIFKPWSHRPSKQTYLDGAIYHDNPIQIADKERKLIWPNMRDEVPDLIVSIGSTFFPKSRTGIEKLLGSRLGVLSHGKQIYRIANHSIASTMNSEKTWENYISILQPSPINRLRYVRLNPQLDEEPPRLDEVHRMEHIQRLVREKWRDNQEIRRVSRQLIASSFYFEKSTDVELTADQRFRCKGHIYCRPLEESDQIRELGKFLRQTTEDGPDPYFLIKEKNSRQAERAVIDSKLIEKMIRSRKFTMSLITVQLSEKLAITEISLCLSEGEVFPISRFPRSLLEDGDNYKKTRQNLNHNPMRWSGQRLNQQQPRTEWVPPQINHKLQPLAHYSDPSYVLGNSTTQDLERTARMLKFGEIAEPEYAAKLEGTAAGTWIGKGAWIDNGTPPRVFFELPGSEIDNELE